MHNLLKIRFKTISPEMDLFAGQQKGGDWALISGHEITFCSQLATSPCRLPLLATIKSNYIQRAIGLNNTGPLRQRYWEHISYIMCVQVEKAPLETYADVGGLDQQIQEIKEAVELPLTHPELYEDIGIKPPKVRNISCFFIISASCAANLSRLKNVADSFKKDGVTLRLHGLESQTQWTIGWLVFHLKGEFLFPCSWSHHMYGESQVRYCSWAQI